MPVFMNYDKEKWCICMYVNEKMLINNNEIHNNPMYNNIINNITTSIEMALNEYNNSHHNKPKQRKKIGF